MSPLRVTFVPRPAEIRVGYAVNRRVGTAVVRNRLRRRLRDLARHMARDAGLAPGDYLVAAEPAAARASYQELEQAFAAALEQVGARLTPPGGADD